MNIREKIKTMNEGIRHYRRTFEADKPENRAVQIYDVNGKVIQKSRNLRGILDYSRKNVPDLIVVNKVSGTSGEANVDFHWSNGSYAAVSFASFDVAKSWVKRRALSGARIQIKEAQTEQDDEGDEDEGEELTPEQFQAALADLKDILQDLSDYAEAEEDDSAEALKKALEAISEITSNEEE